MKVSGYYFYEEVRQKQHRRETALIDRQIFLSLEAAAWAPDIHPDMQMKIGPQQERGALNQAT